MDRGSKQTFFQGRHTNGQRAHAKMRAITDQKRNETSLHSCGDGYQQKEKKFHVLKRRQRIQNPPALWVDCKSVQLLWKKVWRLLKRLRKNYHMTQLFHFCVFT